MSPNARKTLLAASALALLGLAAGLMLRDRRPAGRPTADSLADDGTGSYDRAAKRAFYGSLRPEEQARVIKLKSRWLLPGTRLRPAAGPTQVFLQFKRWLTAAEKQALAGGGVRLGDPLGGHSYRATIEKGAWKRLKDHPQLEGLARPGLADKLHEPVYRMVREGRGGVPVVLEPAPGADLRGLRVIRRLGRRARFHRRDVVVRLDAPRIRELAAREEVAYVHFAGCIPEEHLPPALQEPVPAPDNEDAATIHNVDDLHGAPYNLDGAGVKVSEIDTGQVRATHEAFGGRVTLVEVDQDVSGHSTHVAGTIVGDPAGVPEARGMAPAATLYSYDFQTDPLYPHQKMGDSVDVKGCIVNNNSWGYVGGWYMVSAGPPEVWDELPHTIFGDYDWYARQWDLEVAARNAVVCKSAGNDRDDHDPADPADHDGVEHATAGLTNPYYDCISNWGCSKNVICVGATDDASVICEFSSTGPADDGRVKPDVVANGADVLSAYHTADDAYAWMWGTSMSCPVASGISALATEAWREAHGGADPPAMVVKALLVQTAVDLGHPGPDYVYGFGLLDAQAAVDLLQADAGGNRRIAQDDVANAAQKEFTLPAVVGGTQVKVTLTWLDPAGASGADPAIVNDLDLELVAPDLTVHYPYRLNPADPPADAVNDAKNAVDTVEQAVATCAITGDWTLRVKGASVPSGPQSFVVATNVDITLSDPTIELSKASLSPSANAGSDAPADSFTVRNSGAGTLNYAITDDVGWLSCAPTPGSSTGEPDAITVNYDTDALGGGTYSATITVADAAATNNPRTISVELTIFEPATARSPASLTPSVLEGQDAASQTFEVWNSGDGVLNYTITDDAGWLSCAPSPGSSTGEHDTITVTYDTDALSAGPYNGTVTITDPNASNDPQTVAVTLTVVGPAIALDKTALAPSVTVGGNAASQTFEVWNSGGGTLDYAITDDAGWLSCAPTPGSSTGEHDTITVTYDSGSLAVGTHNATITITDPNASNNPRTVTVTLTVKKKSSGGGGGGGCALAAGGDPLPWALPYLALAAGWVLARLRRRRAR